MLKKAVFTDFRRQLGSFGGGGEQNALQCNATFSPTRKTPMKLLSSIHYPRASTPQLILVLELEKNHPIDAKMENFWQVGSYKKSVRISLCIEAVLSSFHKKMNTSSLNCANCANPTELDLNQRKNLLTLQMSSPISNENTHPRPPEAMVVSQKKPYSLISPSQI